MIFYNRGIHKIQNRKMDYISFGDIDGEPLLIIPGIGDGLSTVGEKSIEKVMFFLNYGSKYNVIIASRAEPVKKPPSIETMAFEYMDLMESTGYRSYNVMGISMGGMIAQFLAYYAINKIKKAVFAVTVPYGNENLFQIVKRWMHFAINRDYIGLRLDMYKKTFQPAKALIYFTTMFLTSYLYWPSEFSRFLKHGEACFNFDAREILPYINIPSLVISGAQDIIMLPQYGKELAKILPKSEFFVLNKAGHGAFDDKKYEFDNKILSFLEEN